MSKSTYLKDPIKFLRNELDARYKKLRSELELVNDPDLSFPGSICLDVTKLKLSIEDFKSILSALGKLK